MRRPIHVTRPALPPLAEFVPYLEQIWESGVMTHNGPLMQRLERDLAEFLGVPDVVCMSNGTAALSAGLRALELTGEVITTPFTFVATANVIRWEGCRPVFVDVDADTWNLDPGLIEAAITPRTSAIMPVHVFSRPCEVEQIDAIAARHGLKVVYDAAHAMNVRRGGRSVLHSGTVSALSFHATKLFNTVEGGACITADRELAERMRRMRFFGFDRDKAIVDEGTNFKMTEVSAALGLANLPHLEGVEERRRHGYHLYEECLRDAASVTFQHYDEAEYNFSYMPVVFDSEERLLRVATVLAKDGVHPRRYFHPALHTVAHFGTDVDLPVAERIAATVLCLPLYDGLEDDAIRHIAALVAGA